eukprot:TRINITY_DN902_c0_g1_i2.p1 TRINITY_DN902_c0_g1~~TRINITY_DN902_c0_g1_i2.p1  ORF type:complete len:452 (+),score=191.58 TRINITY_DN902_c0_g1_i2:86-1441(+)
MPLIKCISRSPQDNNNRHEFFKNADPILHPFERSREISRTIVGAKLERLFAKPFFGALSGHTDGVYSLARHPTDLKLVASGSGNGEIRVWDVSLQKQLWYIPRAHSSIIQSIALPDARHNNLMLTCSPDCTVKLWRLDLSEEGGFEYSSTPVSTWTSDEAFRSLDYQRSHINYSLNFATAAGSLLQIWDITRAEPITSLEYTDDTVVHVRFNPSERNLLAASASDCTIGLADVRTSNPIRKIVTAMRTNSISWNPREPIYFSAANEDHNVYTFDIRNTQQALQVHVGHVAAILDIDYSPTGREFTTASYDQTVRIFNHKERLERDIYYTGRMQRIFAVRFTADSRFILSGSDDANVRIWKAKSSAPVGLISRQAQSKIDYFDNLKKRYANLPIVSSIITHRKLPKPIYRAKIVKRQHIKAKNRRLDNLQKHSRPGLTIKKNIRIENISSKT